MNKDITRPQDFMRVRFLNTMYSKILEVVRYAAYGVPLIAAAQHTDTWAATFAIAAGSGKFLKKPIINLQNAFSFKAYNQDESVSTTFVESIGQTKPEIAKWVATRLAISAAWAAAAGVAGYALDNYAEYSHQETAKKAAIEEANYLKERTRMQALPELPAEAIAQPTNRQYYCSTLESGYKEVRIKGVSMKLNCGG